MKIRHKHSTERRSVLHNWTTLQQHRAFGKSRNIDWNTELITKTPNHCMKQEIFWNVCREKKYSKEILTVGCMNGNERCKMWISISQVAFFLWDWILIFPFNVVYLFTYARIIESKRERVPWLSTESRLDGCFRAKQAKQFAKTNMAESRDLSSVHRIMKLQFPFPILFKHEWRLFTCDCPTSGYYNLTMKQRQDKSQFRISSSTIEKLISLL